MSDALARVFAIQQREINSKLQAQLQAQAREERERAAFMSSPVCRMIIEFAELPVKSGAVAYMHEPGPELFKHTMWNYNNLVAGRLNSIELRVRSNESVHFSCRENRDSGNMTYIAKVGGLTYERTTPDTDFTTLFINYAASVLKPNEVEKAMATAAETTNNNNSRRKLQAV